MPTCPNCRAAIEASAAECEKCGALFGTGSVWSPVVAADSNPKHTVLNDSKFTTLVRLVVCCLLIIGVMKAGAFVLVFVFLSMFGLGNSPIAGSIFLAAAYIPLALLAFRASMKRSPFNPFVIFVASLPLAFEVSGTILRLFRS